MRLSTEPVVWMALVRAILALAVIFGLGLPIGADVAILAVAECALAVLTRSRVSPVNSTVVEDEVVEDNVSPYPTAAPVRSVVARQSF